MPSSLCEDDGLVLVGEDLALDVLEDGTAEDDLLKVLALIDEGLRCVLVRDPYDILLDDRPGVKIFCDIVACGSYDLNSPFECLVVWLGSHEGRKEGVMDVDDVVRILLNHLRRDDLHVFGEDYEIHTELVEQLHLLRLKLPSIGLVNRKTVVRDAETLSHRAEIFVVADYAGDINIPLTGGITRKYIEKAVILLAYEQSHLRLHIAEIETELHLIFLGEQSLEIFLNLLAGNGEAVKLPLQPHEKDLIDPVHILVSIYDIAVIDGDEIRNFRHNALSVRTMKQKTCGCTHGNALLT